MTQEILDCWLTKFFFILSDDSDLLEFVSEEEKLLLICKSISTIIDNDDFFYTSPLFIERLEDLILKKRFDGKHSREIVMYFNKMIDVIKKYRNMTYSEIRNITKNWVKKEKENYGLNYFWLLYDKYDIYHFIADDYYNAHLFLGNAVYDKEYSSASLLATINKLLIKYPNTFIDDEVVIYNMESLCNQIGMHFITDKIIANNTKNRLNKYIYKQKVKKEDEY